MESAGAGSSSSGQNVQEQIDVSMTGVTNGASEGSQAKENADGLKAASAQLDRAASIPIVDGSTVEVKLLPQPSLPRDLQARGRAGRIEKLGVHSSLREVQFQGQVLQPQCLQKTYQYYRGDCSTR